MTVTWNQKAVLEILKIRWKCHRMGSMIEVWGTDNHWPIVCSFVNFSIVLHCARGTGVLRIAPPTEQCSSAPQDSGHTSCATMRGAKRLSYSRSVFQVQLNCMPTMSVSAARKYHANLNRARQKLVQFQNLGAQKVRIRHMVSVNFLPLWKCKNLNILWFNCVPCGVNWHEENSRTKNNNKNNNNKE